MIVEGLKLALLGMSVVFTFLVLLVLVVYISAYLLKPFTDKELRISSAKQGARFGSPASDDKKIMAVISAAIAAHRLRKQSR